MLRHKVGMLAKPITRSLDLDDDGVVKLPFPFGLGEGTDDVGEAC